jgi:hypothetical protein
LAHFHREQVLLNYSPSEQLVADSIYVAQTNFFFQQNTTVSDAIAVAYYTLHLFVISPRKCAFTSVD